MKIKNTLISLVFLLLYIVNYSNTITVTNTQDSGFGSLRDAVSIALIGDTIRFNSSLLNVGNDTIFLSSTINVSKKLVFKGSYNSTDTLFISGSNQITPFYFSGVSKVVLDSISIIDSKSINHGGGLKFFGIDTVQITNSMVKNCSATGNGGGIYISTNKFNSIIDFTNSTFSHNKSEALGGGIYIYNGGFLSINYVNNYADSNFSKSLGAALYVHSSNNVEINIEESTWYRNLSHGTGGGAIWLYNISFGGYTKFEVYNSELIENSALYGSGGAISIQSTGSSSPIRFYSYTTKYLRNFAQINGGAVSIDSEQKADLECINNQIEDNISHNTGAGLFCYSRADTSEIRVFNSTLCNNITDVNGGGIFSRAHTLSLINIETSTLYRNITTTGGGAAITATSSSGSCKLHINKSTIYQNETKRTGGGYGGILMNSFGGTSIITMKNSIFSDNKPTSYFLFPTSGITSFGYNAFSDNLTSGYLSTDLIGADSSVILLDTIRYNGDPTKTLMPKSGSPLLNRGEPTDFDEAQNGDINDVRRDIGACERNASNYISISEKTIINTEVYPNPTHGTFTLKFEEAIKLTSIFITDINGRLVKEITPKNVTQYEISFEGSSGVYFLNLVGENKKSTLKLVKN
ncbi:MAG: T9SS type A sorting domain-containing protein [Flavobacteriales bacterium]